MEGRRSPELAEAISEAVAEVTSTYRSLPARPSLEELEAAASVIRGADDEKAQALAEIGRLAKPPGLDEELFAVVKEVRQCAAEYRAYEQRREALHVLELERRMQVFDLLIQRVSKITLGVDSLSEDEAPNRETQKSAVSVQLEETQKKALGAFRESMGTPPTSSELFAGTAESDKLSLMKVASLIEVSAKGKSGVLDLQGKLKDQIEWLPVSLGKLEHVTELNLSENRIMALPSTIQNLRFLTKLDVHSNQLINLPDSFGELSNLTDLNLRANRLKSLPDSFSKLRNLINLDVSSNNLSALPPSLGNLTKLRTINAETNELEELPYTIGSCSSLTVLMLDFNQLRALPEAVGKIENLEVLTLHYNRIRTLPTTMGSLSYLKELDVSFNELEAIPESLCLATSLTKLNVGKNFADLRYLPRSIGNLEMLEELDISDNQIRVLPDSFRFLSKLKVFLTDETPLEVPPRHIVNMGAQAVVEYIHDLVVSKDTTEEIQDTQGFCSWFCSSCLSLSKGDHTGIPSVTA